MKKVTTFPFSPHVSEFKTIFSILDSGFLHSEFQLLVGVRNSLTCIPDSKTQDYTFHKQKISRILESDSFSWGCFLILEEAWTLNLGKSEKIGSNRLIRLSGFRNPWKFCLWNLESGTFLLVSGIWILALESIIQLNESGIPLTIKIPESKFHWQRIYSPVFGIRNLWRAWLLCES